jgi:hypothetical protein
MLQATYDEAIIPDLEDLLRSSGLDATFYCSTHNTIEFELDGSGDPDIRIVVKERMFQVWEWTWISDDWAEYQLAFELSKEVLH